MRLTHRRWVAWRIVERVGLGILFGCATCIPLIAIHWWQGQDAVVPVIVVLAVSALSGLILAIIRRPTLLQTAIEADRQLQLSDLLTTAMTLSSCRYAEDDWRCAIRTGAEASCRKLSPSTLVLHRLGSRAWGGIGLSAALVLTLSLMTTAPTRTGANVDPSDLSRDAPLAGLESSLQLSQGLPAPRTSARPHAPRDSIAPPSHSDPTSSNDASSGSMTAPLGDTESTASSSDGAGAASAQTDATASPTRLDPARSTLARKGADSPGGAGAGDLTASVDSRASGTSRSPFVKTPPWQTASWPSDRANAMEQIRSGNIPDAYRDLIRDYFAQDDQAPL